MYAIHFPSVDPALNLALEETLFLSLRPTDPGWFLLWRNAPSIIVGRHQNTLEEINSDLVRRYHLPVVRRLTGGGAVYHDPGNLNFSFLVPARPGADTSFRHFLTPVMAALQELGIPCVCSGRNDLLIGERKFSGSAQWRNKTAILHHGTLLIRPNLDMLGAVLTGAPDKYLSKGIKSVRSRVCALADYLPAGIGEDTLVRALERHCAEGSGEIPADLYARAERLAAEKYRSDAWNYGASPRFTVRCRQRFPWGAVDCRLNVQQGIIRQCRIFGDFFSHGTVSALEERLTDIPYTPESITSALSDVDLTLFFAGSHGDELQKLLIDPEQSA